LIDWDFEDRLVDRIAARELIAARLTPQQRQVLCRQVRYGETLREIGAHVGLTSARVGQIARRAYRRLDNEGAPVIARGRVAAPLAPLNFDRAAFLAHMQGVIERRRLAHREEIARERAELDRLLAREFPPPIPQPQMTAAAMLRKAAALHNAPAVEPWFDLSLVLTIQGVRQIALYALNYLDAIRRQYRRAGTSEIGATLVQMECTRDADAIAAALQCLNREIPVTATLSVHPLPIPAGMLGTSLASAYAAVRVISISGDQSVSIEVTWND
jgi:hypothetical protein